jgi:hypothetical protein
MPIMWRCSCGRLLSAKEEFACRQAPCPACNTVHTIPNPAKLAQPPEEEFDAEAVEEQEPQEEILDALPVNEPAGKISGGITSKPVRSKDKPGARESPDIDRPPPRRPRATRRRRRRGPIIVDDDENDMFELPRGWYGNIYGGVIGGALMIFMSFGLFVGSIYVRGVCCGLPLALPILSVVLFVTGVAAIIIGLIPKR